MPLTKENTYKYKYNDAPVCPHCDNVMDIIKHRSIYTNGFTKIGEKFINCTECNEKIIVEVVEDISFSTRIAV